MYRVLITVTVVSEDTSHPKVPGQHANVSVSTQVVGFESAEMANAAVKRFENMRKSLYLEAKIQYTAVPLY